MHEHGHGEDDPFLQADMAERWERWMPVVETGTRAVTEALLDATSTGPGTRMLDLACGLGPVACAAAARGATATGLDLNPDMLARAPDCGATFVEGDMVAPPAGPWDAIVSRFGAHHAPPGWLDAATAVLAPGGRLAIAEWAPDTALFAGGEHAGPTEETAADWVPRFEAAGLRNIVVSEVTFTIDFGDAATYRRFGQDMAHGNGPAPTDGKQENKVFLVAAQRQNMK